MFSPFQTWYKGRQGMIGILYNKQRIKNEGIMLCDLNIKWQEIKGV